MEMPKYICWLLSPCLWVSSSFANENNSDALLSLSLESLLQVQISVASPFDERVVDAAASVAVLTPSDWQKRGAKTVAQTLEQIPSVESYASLGSAYMTAIRGYATELSSRGIASLLDGVPLNDFSYATSVYDTPFIPLPLLSRIEVIRGSGSTLYGSDAFHGVLSLSTQQSIEPNSQISVAMGTNDSANINALTTIGNKRFSLQSGVALTHFGQQNLNYGYHEPQHNQWAEGARDNQLQDATGFLHLIVGDKSEPMGSWGLSFYANQYEGRGFAGAGTQFYPPLKKAIKSPNVNFAADNDVSGQDSHFGMIKLKHERQLGQSIELALTAYQWQSEQTWLFDFNRYPQTSTRADGAIVPCKASPTQVGVSALFCPHNLRQGVSDTRQGSEMLLRQDGDFNQWAIGAGVDWMKVDKAFVQRVSALGQYYVDSRTPFEGAKRRIDHIFFHARHLFLNGQLSAVYGVRWDDYHDIDSATSPRLGFIYRWNDQWINKLLFAHAFRAPSAAERYGSGAGSQQLENLNIKPETIDSIEWITLHQGQAQESELTLFRSLWKDSIVLTPVTNVLSQYQNRGDNRAYGVELSHTQHWQHWHLQGSASWVRSENVQTQKEYSAFPQYSINLGVGRSLAENWHIWLNQRLLFNRTTTDALGVEPIVKAGNYYRTDFHIEKKMPNWRCWLDIRNALNQNNITPSLYNAEGGIPDEKINATIGVERSW